MISSRKDNPFGSKHCNASRRKPNSGSGASSWPGASQGVRFGFYRSKASSARTLWGSGEPSGASRSSLRDSQVSPDASQGLPEPLPELPEPLQGPSRSPPEPSNLGLHLKFGKQTAFVPLNNCQIMSFAKWTAFSGPCFKDPQGQCRSAACGGARKFGGLDK